MTAMSLIRAAALFGAVAGLAACAGATVGSGVGDRLLSRPPWQAGRRGVASDRVGAFPIAYQAGASFPEAFDPPGGDRSAVGALVQEMNHHLRQSSGVVALPPVHPSTARPPDVSFGCELDAMEECAPWDVGRPVHRLAVARPAAAWVTGAAEAMTQAEADAALVITLEVGQYLPRQRDLLGRKSVELSQDHVVSLPWLTSLETPVGVLQLTGALVNREGRAIRIAAVGVLARRTSLLASSVGLQAILTEDEVRQARTARREDLPGRPLTWMAALDDLVRALVEP